MTSTLEQMETWRDQMRRYKTVNIPSEEFAAILEVLERPDMARFSASEGAGYAYPGKDHQALRMAFCDGAVYAITGKLPDDCPSCLAGLPVFEGQHIREDYHRAPNGDRIICTKKPSK